MSKWTNKTLRTVKDWPLEIVEAGEEGKPIGGSIYEAEDRKRFAHPIVSINHTSLSTFAHKLTDKEEAKALAARVVETFNACTGITFTGDSAGLVREMAQALMLMVELWDANHADDTCACMGASDDCPYPPTCELCQARAVLERVRVEEEIK